MVSPGDVSEIGVYIARELKLPLAISWHTNLHKFAAMRLDKMLWWMPEETRKGVVEFSEAQVPGSVLYAPDDELVDMLRERTGKPVFLMKRGIDTELFTREAPSTTASCGSVMWAGSPRRRACAFCAISKRGCWRRACRRSAS